ncbi:hypothetical protein PLESTB_000171600 [Pleodorina starrii]|uniref:Cytochrome b5 heme-binding domain-containing protein n=1 Tax=Pleodorina starrii TaxID=330485 RepID=A0A9W6BC10_9CHLO|nr:hypothetical protein PLESTM_000525300 [Pleodorina starrii]GLC49000.1 hypothetical protein PLESTB_000171600 [Pleodorina starrii]GLC66205.1 hypothetical protein PLESTF_000396300 [Pleodorina starrii]
MSGCPFASMWGPTNDAGDGPSASAESDLRHSHSSVHLQAQISSAGADAISLSRAISTPHLQSEEPTSTSSSLPSIPTPAPATALPTPSIPTTTVAALAPQAPSSSPSSSATAQRLTRRQLRRLGKAWSLSEVRQHARKDDAWIAVDGKVYDITEHLVNHPGWEDSSAISTVLSILAHSGTDCSQEFREIHRPYPVAWRQLQAYYIGELAPEEEGANSGNV